MEGTPRLANANKNWGATYLQDKNNMRIYTSLKTKIKMNTWN